MPDRFTPAQVWFGFGSDPVIGRYVLVVPRAQWWSHRCPLRERLTGRLDHFPSFLVEVGDGIFSIPEGMAEHSLHIALMRLGFIENRDLTASPARPAPVEESPAPHPRDMSGDPSVYDILLGPDPFGDDK